MGATESFAWKANGTVLDGVLCVCVTVGAPTESRLSGLCAPARNGVGKGGHADDACVVLGRGPQSDWVFVAVRGRGVARDATWDSLSSAIDDVDRDRPRAASA